MGDVAKVKKKRGRTKRGDPNISSGVILRDLDFALTPAQLELLHNLLARAVHDVRRPLVVGDVEAHLLLEGVDAEQAEDVQEVEVREHNHCDPGDDPQDAADLREEEASVAAVEHSPLPVVLEGCRDERGLGE